jgi:hypothetical protein
MIVPSQLALKNHTNFRCIASLATLDKLVDRFPLPPVAPPIGDTSLTHVMRLAAHSTTSPTLTAMGHLFIMILYIQSYSRIIMGLTNATGYTFSESVDHALGVPSLE